MGSRRVLICDELPGEALQKALAVLEQAGLEPQVRTGLTPSELAQAAAEVDALIVRSATRVTRAVLERATRLAVVGRAGVGVDNIDVDACTDHGVLVVNAPQGNTQATAELTLAHLFALARHLPAADRAVREGQWNKKSKLIGCEVQGKVLGVIGLGRIGRAVAQRARGLGLEVLGHDPFLSPDGSAGGGPLEGVELLSLDVLLERCDFVTLHVPYSAATHHLIDAARLARMKRGARLINCARGGLVDEPALLEALSSGQLAGAALDVFESEPPPAGHPLLERGDVVLSPHLGASSSEAQTSVAIEIAREIAGFLNEGLANQAVNAPMLSRATLRELAPWIRLLERVGSFLAQRSSAPLAALELELLGELRSRPREHLHLALLVGALRHGSDTPVNYVRAPRIARERGLTLVEGTGGPSEFVHGLVRVRALPRGGERAQELEASVIGREGRILRLDGVELDLPLEGTILITRHADVPGAVGALGTALGQAQVNVRRIELGPLREGQALGLWSLYGEPPADLLAHLAPLAPLYSAQIVRL
jgi:D-3-phosphoglycerate dehydrogenase